MTEQRELPGIPNPPTVIKNTLFQRALLEFSSYQYGKYKNIFIQGKYIDGLANEKKECLMRFNKSLNLSFFLSLLLLSYVSGIRFDIEIFGNKIFQFPAVVEVLTFFCAFAFFGTILMMIDFLFVDQMIDQLCRDAFGFQSPRYVYANSNAYGIWADLLSIRALGYASGKTQTLVSTIMLVILVIVIGVLVLFIAGAIFYSSYIIFSSEKIISSLFVSLVVFGDILTVVALLILIISLCIPFEFKIRSVQSSNR